MADFVLKSTPNIVIASYCASRLAQYAGQFGKRFMLILDPVLRAVGLQEKITQSLNSSKIDYFIFDELSEVADTKAVSTALNLARTSHVQGVIAAGGGRTFSVARAVCALFYEPGDFYSYVDGNPCSAKTLPLICLNSTCRDSFVFSDKIPVLDARTNSGKILKVQDGLCKTVMFDPNLFVTLTENQKHTMLFESLCLALESYVSQKSNFFSEMVAEKSAELLGIPLSEEKSLSITTPTEELLVHGGTAASLAAGTSSLGVASLLAMSINARYKVGHALVCSILLPNIIEEYGKFKAERIANFADIFVPQEAEHSTDEKVASFASFIREQIAKFNLPARLKDLSLSIEQLSLAVEDAGKTEIMNSLPRAMTTDELFEFVKNAY